ncbi:MAG: DUF92 domain-containing protein [Candidatus Marsarchaeota archaeon]|jgi:uncharacterized protein (TIGR00297 family)|nr:DUF92 domain-containing protein [Candidatus Marsarchaeota archaeon]
MKAVFTLDARGLGSAVILGVLLLVLGRSEGPLFLASMLFFLVASAAVTSVKSSRKRALDVLEKERGWRNVWANGAVPLFLAALYFIVDLRNGFGAGAIVVAYIASVAAITADKFSSELGVLDKKAFMLLTGKEVRVGVSGGVSVLGLAAGLAAAGLVSVLFSFAFSFSVEAIAVVLLSGFAGDVIDSVFGYFEEHGAGNKFTTNVACAASAALIALLVYAVAYGPYLI